MTARLTSRPGGPARLRALLDSGELIMAPGAFDPLAARLAEEAGFPAVYMTGFGTSAALLGRPDVGLLTMTEMAGNAGRIADCVDIPVIADADTGYGNPLNVIRTVGAFESAGVAAIHLEDQVAPKKCGHMEGKQVIRPPRWQPRSGQPLTPGLIRNSCSSPEPTPARSKGSSRRWIAPGGTAKPARTHCSSRR